ncbi:MAG: CRTAC1 family protein [Phycisphaerales bacterium]
MTSARPAFACCAVSLVLLSGGLLTGGCGPTNGPAEDAAAPDPAAPGGVARASAAHSPEPSGAADASAPAAPGASPAPAALGWFAERTGNETGLQIRMTAGADRTREILEVNGGGIGLIDHDGDGDLDVFVAVGASLERPDDGPPSRLFRNDGDLRFTDVTAEAGIDLRGWSTGVAVGDVDGDRRDDLFVGRLRGGTLLLNRTEPGGPATFVDASDDAGIDGGWITSAAFADLDGDDDLDLYTVRYLEFDPAAPPPRAAFKGIEVMGGPHGLVATHDSVYENDGRGRFIDRTDAWGMRPPSAAYGLNLVIVDALPGPEGADDRPWPEIIVGNDSQANFVWQRQADGRWRDVGFESGLASNGDGSEQATMGMAVGDVNEDGWPDLFTTNFSSDTNTLHVSGDTGYFADATRRAGLGIVSRPFLGWAAWFADWDHDGHEDLLMFNGHVYPQATPEAMDSAWEQPPLLFTRQADRLRFARVTGPDWLATPRRDRAAAFGDLDGDGDVDVVVGELNRPVRVLESLAAAPATAGSADGSASAASAATVATPANSLIITLDDQRAGTGNHRGIGARIQVVHGGRTATRWMLSGGGFQSSSAAEVHVALPRETAAVGDRRPDAPDGDAGDGATVSVRWPDGFEQSTANVRPGRHVVVRRD